MSMSVQLETLEC